MQAAIGPRPMADAGTGQQGTLTRVWAKRGSRPRVPRDTRYDGPAASARSARAAPPPPASSFPFVNTAAMNAHLAEIARRVEPGAHAILVLDGAGWHRRKTLAVPDNISLLALPPLSLEGLSG